MKIKPAFQFSIKRDLAFIFILLLVLSCNEEDNRVPPTLVTNEVSSIFIDSCLSGGRIIDKGNAEIISGGVFWDTDNNPSSDFNLGKTKDIIKSGSFVSNITGLLPNTTYYIRAYVITNIGVSYGNTVSFTTPDGVFDVDGNRYLAVKIGTQTWLKRNLATTKLNDSTDISYGLNLTIPAYYWYVIYNKDEYGALYNWHAVNTGKLCPTGWHVPSVDEWDVLADFCGGANSAAIKLKALSNWQDMNGTDDFGFSAIAAGLATNTRTATEGGWAAWWSTSSRTGRRIIAGFPSLQNYTYDNYLNNEYELSVRCLKNSGDK